MILATMMLATATAGAADPRCASVQTSDLIACAQADYARADAALNAEWGHALAAAKARGAGTSAADRAANGNLSYAQALLAAQRAWLGYRDAECRLRVYANAGGRELPIYRFGCLTELTRQRTQALRDDFTEGR